MQCNFELSIVVLSTIILTFNFRFNVHKKNNTFKNTQSCFAAIPMQTIHIIIIQYIFYVTLFSVTKTPPLASRFEYIKIDVIFVAEEINVKAKTCFVATIISKSFYG